MIRPDHLSDHVLRPASGNVFELTVEQLATAIRLGAFHDGDLLPPERELAERLAVSRSTLRDAIAALRESGLVTTRRGRGGGTMVTYAGESPESGPSPQLERTADEIADVLDFRRVVEPGAAALAATRALTADQRSWLSTCASHVREAPDTATLRLSDSRLHLALATLSGSPMLVEAVTRAQAAVRELLSGIPVIARNIAHSHDQHDAIVTAVLAADPDTARAMMEEHCDATSALLRALLRPRG